MKTIPILLALALSPAAFAKIVCEPTPGGALACLDTEKGKTYRIDGDSSPEDFKATGIHCTGTSCVEVKTGRTYALTEDGDTSGGVKGGGETVGGTKGGEEKIDAGSGKGAPESFMTCEYSASGSKCKDSNGNPINVYEGFTASGKGAGIAGGGIAGGYNPYSQFNLGSQPPVGDSPQYGPFLGYSTYPFGGGIGYGTGLGIAMPNEFAGCTRDHSAQEIVCPDGIYKKDSGVNEDYEKHLEEIKKIKGKEKKKGAIEA